MQEVDSPAWNKGRIHYTSTSKEVVDAYAAQFAKDAGNFLDARAMELVPGGMLGLFDESQVDSFNFPYYAPSPVEMTKLIEMNGRFSIERMELTNPAPWLKSIDEVIPEWIIHVRAAMEAIFTRQFGYEVAHEMFQRLTKQLSDKCELLETKYRDKIQFLLF
ncbi:S-adenosylmethionine-dependent methyltransferase [Spatholobus suberectus]|nr:S-adenosylmethionine-dependent methyltransferase [Spatholobus suberectus]